MVLGGAVHVGVDVGENSLGLAAIEKDGDGFPVAVPHLLVVLHDGGKDGMASNQTSSVSRKASGGMARRVRRLFRNRRRRRLALERLLAEIGFPTESYGDSTYEPWEARIALLKDRVEDDRERRRLLSIAIRHMANHRGWANAWVSIDSYVWKEEPSKEFERAVAAAAESDSLGTVDPRSLRYQADLAALALDHRTLIRQRGGRDNLLGVQRRVDVVREWRQICRVQGVDDGTFLSLARVAFGQEKPKVPIERVGNDWLPGYTNRKRAIVASMEHQEFKIRQAVANLAVRESARSNQRSRLSPEDQRLIADQLLGEVDKDKAPSWKDVAEWVGVAPHLLVHASPEEQLTGRAPINTTVVAIHSLPKKHPVLAWWQGADAELRSEFVRWFADPAAIEIRSESEAAFEQIFESLDEKELEAAQKLRFSSGRSGHSIEALRRINAEIEASGDTYVQVRNRLFGGGEDIRPKDLASLDTQADHPTLQRILPPLRRFLFALKRRHGEYPEQVVIEHVREAFLGFEAKREAALRMLRNRRDRELAQQDIANAGLGLVNASDADLRRFQAIRRQNSACLYCGATPGWSGFELDHIVPRASGGNSTQANLVAVCRLCNAAKGKRPFAVFAQSGDRPVVSIDDALRRVEEMDRGRIDARQFWRLKQEMKRRLKQTEEDEAIDERALASTAYAAVDMRERIQMSLGLGPERVPVYSGRIVSMARHASGIDKAITIREGIDTKSRFDRRHHAIDAAVAAMLNPSVARTLAERDDLRRESKLTGVDNGWREYEGSSPRAIERFRQWKTAMIRLAELVDEKLRADEVVVMQPVRFSGRHSKLHEDGRAPHARRRLGAAWTSVDRARIVDDRVYEALSAGLQAGDPLPEDDARTLRLPSGRMLTADDEIFIFPDGSARHPLPNASSAPLGGSVHHARLFRWPGKGGAWNAGIVRVFASDLYDLEGGVEGPILSAPLLARSRAVRRSQLPVREAIERGIAEQVGSFVIGDEIEIVPSEWGTSGKAGEFFARFPERRWRLTGWEQEGVLNLRPMYLALEGATLASDDEEPDSRLVRISRTEEDIIKRTLRVAPSWLWKTPSTRVVRRTALGEPREATTGVPMSWSPHRAVFGD